MIDHPYVMLIAAPAAAYVVGSTPFGVLLARSRGVDLRKVGSGNVGATNVGRALGPAWGVLCFVLDVAKGLAPVLSVWLLLRPAGDFPTPLHQACWLATGCGAIGGHVFSFWLRFRGGKGVATGLGVVLGIYPYFTAAAAAALGLWVAVTLASRYVSLGSVIAAAAFVPILVTLNWSRVGAIWPLVAFAGAMSALIVVRHRANIVRLLRGTEHRLGERRRRPGRDQPDPRRDRM
jgi:glycerol-3-phosphate acyltransferase PlsY